jgi:hypothetical protein
MAERKPLVLVSGMPQELPAADTLPAQAPAVHGSDKHSASYLAATPDFIQFDTTPTVGAVSTGKVFYDETNKTLSMHMGSDVTMQIGQEEYVYVYNPGAEIANGQVVRFLGNEGIYPTVALARADAEETSYALGVATQVIASSGYGFVNVRGMVRDLNTMGAVSGTISSFSDYGGGLVRAHCTADHKLTTGNSVVITDDTYGGTYTITVVDTTTFTFTATWSATSAGTFACAQTWSSGDLLWLCPDTAGCLTNVEPKAPYYRARIARVVVTSATVGIIYVRVFAFTKLEHLGDVAVDAPETDQILRFNGAQWVNGAPSAVSAGAGVDFFPDDTAIYAASANNTYPVKTLSKTPVVTAEDIDSIAVTAATSPVPYGMYLYNTALGSTSIEAGTWAFEIYAGVSSATNTTSLTQGVFRVRPEAGTVTIDNVVGTTARATVSTGTPFDTAKITASADKSLCSYLMITNNTTGLYPITARTSDTVVTIEVPAGYTPAAASTFNVCLSLFTVNTGEMNNVATAPLYAGLLLYSIASAQAAFTIEATDKFATMFFGVSNGTRTAYFSHNGTARYTYFKSPLAIRHNDLAGLQGGSAAERYHLSAAKATEVNAGTIVMTTRTITATSPLTIAGTTAADLSADRTIAIPAATAATPGYMTAAAMTKLDGIAAGATVGIPDPATPEQGDVLYWNGSAWVRLAHGVAGQALITGGNAANPAWGTVSGGGTTANVETLSGAKTIATGDPTYQLLNANGANRNVYLPASPTGDERFVIRNSSTYDSAYYLLVQLSGDTNYFTRLYSQASGEFVYDSTDGLWRWIGPGTGRTRTGADTYDDGYGNVQLGYNANARANGVAIGRGAAGNGNGVSIGLSSSAATNGVAVGGSANGDSSSVGIGNSATGSSGGAAVGAGASASGTNSVASGRSASATGSEAVSIGSSAEATAAGAIAIGKNADAKTTNAVSIGEGAVGGSYGVTLGYYAGSGGVAYPVAIGNEASVTGTAGVAIGKTAATSGAGGVSVGENANAATDYGNAIGEYSKTTRYGETSISGDHASTNKNPWGLVHWKGQTVNGTQAELLLHGVAAKYCTIPADSAFRFVAEIVAKQAATANVATWKCEGVIVNNGGTTVIALDTGSPVACATNGTVSGWAIAFDAVDSTVDYLRPIVTGATDATISWHITATLTEIRD